MAQTKTKEVHPMKSKLSTIKRIVSLVALAVCLFSFCFTPLTAASADVKYKSSPFNVFNPKVTLDTKNAQLLLSKKTLTLTATIECVAKVNVKSVAWTSSNTAVATVSDKGVVTAKKCGTALITVTVKRLIGSDLKASCWFTIFDGSLSLSSSSLSMNVTDSGDSKTLTCSVKDLNVCTSNVTWSSSDKSVATVSDKDKEYGTTATCKVSVTEKKVLDVKSKEQSNGSCCGGAAACAVIRFFKPSFSKKDTDLYKAMGNSSAVYKINNLLNKYIKNSPYAYGTYKTQSSYQNAVIKSIKAGYPVIALVKITSKTYFKYTTNGHFTVIRGYEIAPNGSVTFYIADSYRTSKNGGRFSIPAGTFFGYSKAHGYKYYLILKK